ncbi:BrnT family toxin [Methylobacterium sp. J-067]|uniref:BrnT family toxin n=1 Tax=Methylobacterium sp. J-067 TaxID=2836648 RepID=UPI001FB8BA43|nr:BrnT family toxin [Methylobacterium sp. J-067]MCJ2025274.1 BrnT family toxin [Methylobacterium sp. J-067]
MRAFSITFDPGKRERTLAERGLDFADAAHILAGPRFDFEDLRKEYGERRIVTVGFLADRMVIVIWTRRGRGHHVISMRKANDREQRRYAPFIR